MYIYYFLYKIIKELDNKTYKCCGCGKLLNVFEIQGLIKPQTQQFICDVCSGEIQEQDDSEEQKQSQALLSAFMEFLNPIVKLLKQIERLKVPSYACLICIFQLMC